ncbi:O14AG protein, partial [Chordeiles acutipennis]|nr:O14AG protein [Chordeiles acutipennis]
QQMSNSSSITQFLLLAFADTQELQLLHFWLFLGIYLAALLGNGLIITTIACDHHLHTPMYFFLLNLSLLDLGSISTTLPKSMADSLWDTRAISYLGCAAQLFLSLHPRSPAQLSSRGPGQGSPFSAPSRLSPGGLHLPGGEMGFSISSRWGTGFLNSLLHTISVPLCQGNALDHFFCEIPQILKLFCS